MTTALRTSAEETALPPGLAERAAALVEPDEGVLWAGRGRSGATFAALWPVAVLPALLLAGLLWLWLGFDVRSLPEGWTVRVEGSGYLAGALFGGGCLWILIGFARRVAAAPRTLFVLTSRRLIVKAGRRPADFPLTDIEYAVAGGPERRRALAFQTLRGEGRSGPRPILFGVANGDSAVETLERLGIALRDKRPDLEAPEDGPAAIQPGESLCWSGRRGFGATGANRRLMLGAAVPLMLPFIWGVWFAWSKGNAMDTLPGKLAAGGGLLIVVCIYLGPMAWFILGHAPDFMGDLFVEIFGRVAVTDRRILFIAPLTGAVHRDIPADRIIEALLVDVDPRGRGYISLTLKGEPGEKDEIVDLYSVPDPENALDSIARLIRRP